MKKACILLAAGKSQRFGSAKLLHVLPTGLTIIETTLSKYQPIFEKISVVVREDDSALIQKLKSLNRQQLNLVLSQQSEKGMAHSIVAGLKDTPNSSSWLFALADMPYIQTETISLINAAMNESGIVAPTSTDDGSNRTGNPVAFGSAFKADLMQLEGDAGAKKLIKQFQEKLDLIVVNDAGIFKDIDYPNDVLLG